MSDTNKAEQPQKMARGLKFWISEVEELYHVVKTKTLIICTVTMQLICAFVFAFATSRIARDAAQNEHPLSLIIMFAVGYLDTLTHCILGNFSCFFVVC